MLTTSERRCASPEVKMTNAPELRRLPEADCPMIWIRRPRSIRPKSWDFMEDPVVTLERRLHGQLLTGLLWARTFENVVVEEDSEKVPTTSKWYVSILTDERIVWTP